MPTDITTLAIEVQSRNANSNLLNFNKNLQNSDSLAKEVAKSLGIAFGAASVISYMKMATAQSIAFNRELYNIKSIARELNLDKVRNQLIGLDSRLGYAADNAGAFYFAYSAGVRGSEKELVNFTGEVGKLSQAIVSGQIPTMDAVTSVMNAYGLKASEVTEVTDMFFQVVKQGKTTGSALANSIGAISGVSANAGISINDLGNAIAVLTTTMPTERAITSLSAMITAFIKPTDAAKEAAQKYGIELSAAALKAKGLSGILAEMNQKVGTNTEAIAEIVPSIEGMRAAVALAGGQYKMFADNIEIFANKGGSAAQAFTAQANNLDKQITSIPVTLNKINNEVGETVKSVLTLNGVLTPAIAAFNSMDTETIKLVANITAVVGGIVLLKGAMATINTISSIRQKLIQKNIQQVKDQTALDVQSEEVKRVEIEKINLAEQKSLAMKEAFSKRKIMLDKLEIASLKSKALAEAKTSFSIAKGNEMQRYQRFIQTGEGVYSPNNSYIVAQKQLEIAKKEFASAQKEASEAVKSFNEAKTEAKKLFVPASSTTSPNTAVFPSQMGKSSGNLIQNLKKINSSFVETGSILQRSPLLRMGKTFASQITSLTAWKNGLSGVASALTGGMTGLAGFANALGGIGLAVTTAVSMFKLGGDLRQQFDVWMGWEEGADGAQRRGDEAYAQTQKIIRERQKKQEKSQQDKMKADLNAIQQNEAMNRRIIAAQQFEYEQKTVSERLQQAKSNERIYAYRTSLLKDEVEREKMDAKRLQWSREVLALEKEINRQREMESQKQMRLGQTAYDWSLKLAEGDPGRQMQIMQGRYQELYSAFLKEGDFSKRMELAGGLIDVASQMDQANKTTKSYISGVVSSVDAFQKNSIEAARMESKIYERNPIEEQTKKLDAAIKSVSEKLGLKLDNIDRSTRNAAQIKIV